MISEEIIDSIKKNPEQPIIETVKRVVGQSCQQPRIICKDCRDIFDEGCRFNNTRSFWR